MRVFLIIVLSLMAWQILIPAHADTLRSPGKLELLKEDRARADLLFKRVRCPVCAGQSVAESDAEISKSIRNYIETEILSGGTDQEILLKLVNAYGGDILFSPRLTMDTIFLWAAPLLFLIIGIGIFLRIFGLHMYQERRET